MNARDKRTALRRKFVHGVFMKQWHRIGTLWSADQAAQLEIKILKDCDIETSFLPLSSSDLHARSGYELPFGTEPLGEGQLTRNGRRWDSFTDEEKAQRRREIDEAVYFRRPQKLPEPETPRERRKKNQVLFQKALEKSRDLKPKKAVKKKPKEALARRKPMRLPRIVHSDVWVDPDAQERWNLWVDRVKRGAF